jgi:hypothetical protein
MVFIFVSGNGRDSVALRNWYSSVPIYIYCKIVLLGCICSKVIDHIPLLLLGN